MSHGMPQHGETLCGCFHFHIFHSMLSYKKKNIVFIPFHFSIPFHSISFGISFGIFLHCHIGKRYTATLTTLWQADLLAWKKRYGCEVGKPVGKPVGNPKLRSPWVATVATVATLSYCLVTFLVDV